MWHSKEGAGAAKLRQPTRPAVCWKTSSLVMEQSSGKQKRFALSLCVWKEELEVESPRENSLQMQKREASCASSNPKAKLTAVLQPSPAQHYLTVHPQLPQDRPVPVPRPSLPGNRAGCVSGSLRNVFLVH